MDRGRVARQHQDTRSARTVSRASDTSLAEGSRFRKWFSEKNKEINTHKNRCGKIAKRPREILRTLLRISISIDYKPTVRVTAGTEVRAPLSLYATNRI